MLVSTSKGEFIYISKLVAFVQSLAALFMGYVLRSEVDGKRSFSLFSRYALLVYLVLGVIYALSGGWIESYLFSNISGEITFLSGGRGIAPLSPEPSFFSGIMASLTILYIVTKSKSVFAYSIILLLLVFTFSMSGIYIAILVLILLIELADRRQRIIVFMISCAVIPYIYMHTSVEIVRFLSVIDNVINDGRITDVSTLRRWYAFTNAITVIVDKPFGVGFTKESLGGFVFLIEVYGVFFIPVLFYFFKVMFSYVNTTAEKVFVVGWSLFYLANGFIFIPLTYFAFGYVLGKRK